MTNQAAQTMPELLPCPFCGHNIPEFRAKIKGDPKWHVIKCPDCPCKCEYCSSTEEQAVASWNRRTALSQTAGVAREWTPLDIQTFARAYKAEVPGAVLTVHGIDAGLHALAAAPAASGGGPVDGCEDCAYNGRYLCDTHGPPPAAASVSERARDLLTAEYSKAHANGEHDPDRDEIALRALEQALTQQRGECWPLNKNPKDGWTFDPSFLDEVKTRAEQSDIGEFAPCLEGVESVLIALRGMGDTTPKPSADAVRELVSKMYGGAVAVGSDGQWVSVRRYLLDELESLISGGSHA